MCDQSLSSRIQSILVQNPIKTETISTRVPDSDIFSNDNQQILNLTSKYHELKLSQSMINLCPRDVLDTSDVRALPDISNKNQTFKRQATLSSLQKTQKLTNVNDLVKNPLPDDEDLQLKNLSQSSTDNSQTQYFKNLYKTSTATIASNLERNYNQYRYKQRMVVMSKNNAESQLEKMHKLIRLLVESRASLMKQLYNFNLLAGKFEGQAQEMGKIKQKNQQMRGKLEKKREKK